MDIQTINLFCSKKTDHWQTPENIISKLKYEFGMFMYDPCPRHPIVDGLKTDWHKEECDFIFVNPPYSNCTEWLKKVHDEINKGLDIPIVFLVFANTDTKWFHTYVLNFAEIRFIKGRLTFYNEDQKKKNYAMRPSIFCIFNKKD